MTADVEDEYVVAQANEPLDEDQARSSRPRVNARRRDDILEIDARPTSTYMDVSPKMVVSVATAMIPFLENDDCQPRADGLQHAAAGSAADGHRAARSSATGMEYKAAIDSGVCCSGKERRHR